MHVVEPDGTFVSGGDALVRLSELLPGAAWLARLAEKEPRVRGGVGRAYSAVASRRGSLSRWVPDRPPTVRPKRR